MDMLRDMLRDAKIDDEPMECPTCDGEGEYSIGDVEDGVSEPCPECGGTGEVDHYDDTFIPERDALTPND